MKIISGAQTGVDRSALDAAMSLGYAVGGWCPKGRVAEDGKIPDQYPVTELPNGGYRQRTKLNVIDSDATVIIYFGFPAGGTELTIEFVIKEKKPYILLDAEEISVERAIERVLSFTRRHSVSILNVAGPRAGRESRAYDYTFQVITGVLEKIKQADIREY